MILNIYFSLRNSFFSSGVFHFSCGIFYLAYIVIFLVSSFEVNDISVLIWRLNLDPVNEFSVERFHVRFVFNL